MSKRKADTAASDNPSTKKRRTETAGKSLGAVTLPGSVRNAQFTPMVPPTVTEGNAQTSSAEVSLIQGDNSAGTNSTQLLASTGQAVSLLVNNKTRLAEVLEETPGQHTRSEGVAQAPATQPPNQISPNQNKVKTADPMPGFSEEVPIPPSSCPGSPARTSDQSAAVKKQLSRSKATQTSQEPPPGLWKKDGTMMEGEEYDQWHAANQAYWNAKQKVTTVSIEMADSTDTEDEVPSGVLMEFELRAREKRRAEKRQRAEQKEKGIETKEVKDLKKFYR